MTGNRIKYERALLAGFTLSVTCHLLAAFVPAGLIGFLTTSDKPPARAVRFEVVTLPEPEKIPVYQEGMARPARIMTSLPLAPPAPRLRQADSVMAALAEPEIPEIVPLPGEAWAGEMESGAGEDAQGKDSVQTITSYIAGVYDRISRVRRYPESSRRLGEEGAVEISFAIGRDGALAGQTELASASPFSALNRAAGLSVRSSSPFPPLPACIHEPVLPLKVTILFQLEK